MATLGFGLAPCGVAPYGFGTPATAPEPGGKLFRDTNTGESRTGRYINARTKDYEYDSYGRATGMSTAQQIVQIALMTDKGSSAVADLGHELASLEDITSDFDRRIDTTIRAALQDAVNRKLIRLDSVTSERMGTNGAFIRVRWTDLSTGVQQSTVI